MPETIREFVLKQEIYNQPSVQEAAMKALAIMEKNRACIWSNTLSYRTETKEFKVVLNTSQNAKKKGKQTGVQPFDETEFMSWATKCKKPVVGVLLSIYVKGEGGHANMLVINHRRKELEHFEPNGSNWPFATSNQDVYVNKLSAMFTKLFPGYKYVPPSETCPNLFTISKDKQLGPQNVQEIKTTRVPGACSIWSIWFLHLRLTNPDEAPKETSSRAMITALGQNTKPPNVDHVNPKVKEVCWNFANHQSSACSDNDWVKKTCKVECDYAKRVRSGGKLESFLVKFTTQIIALINLKLVKETVADCKNGKGELTAMLCTRADCSKCQNHRTVTCARVGAYKKSLFGCEEDPSVPKSKVPKTAPKTKPPRSKAPKPSKAAASKPKSPRPKAPKPSKAAAPKPKSARRPARRRSGRAKPQPKAPTPRTLAQAKATKPPAANGAARRRSGRATPARQTSQGRCNATTAQGGQCKRPSAGGQRCCTQHAKLGKAGC